MKHWIGCSGFFYKGWKDRFYPKGLPQKKWFEYYCEHFNTVELNTTFYHFPSLESLKKMYSESPKKFKFSAKMSRGVTHYRKFSKPDDEVIKRFYERVYEGLQEKLGSVLFQCHPVMTYSPEKLHQIIDNLDTLLQNAIEFRHKSWWNEEVMTAFKQKKITFCGISYPDLPDQIVATSPVVYYRFHGVPDLYRSKYSTSFLKKISNSIKALPKSKEVYLYFNNDIDVAAVTNAKQLQTLLI